jgi:hypothetical protein
MRDWWQWNINRLCLGFELTYSHQPRSFVHWEHTRVMMMFLKTLMCAYGGQGNHLRRSVGLWIDRRERRPGDGAGLERIQEGMSYGIHLAQFGYAWMADKIDWAAMTFLAAHRAHMVFNTPSLQSAYVAHYPEIVAAKADLILLGDVLYRLEQHRSDPKRSALLLRLLVDFCLRAYRKDVFEALSRRKTKQPKDSDRLTEARMGDVPLTGAGFRSVFRGGILDDDVHFVHAKSRMHVTHVHTLFSWVFGWDGDGDRGDWQREGWEYQPYRTIYFQCFSVVARLFGIQQAREWRLRVRQTWIRTHWLLPYPGSTRFWARDRGGRLQMWASIHSGLEHYIETHRASRSTVVRPRDVRKLPLTGWEPGACPSQLDVELPIIPADLDVYLVNVEPPTSEDRPTVVLPATGVQEGTLSQFIQAHQPDRRILRSFLRDQAVSASTVHSNEEWLETHLVHYLRAVVTTYRHEVNALQPPGVTRRWKQRSRPRLTRGLAQVGLSLEQLEEGDSDPETLRAGEERFAGRLAQAQTRLQTAQKDSMRLRQCHTILADIKKREQKGNWTAEESQREIEVFRAVKSQRLKSYRRLNELSKKCISKAGLK